MRRHRTNPSVGVEHGIFAVGAAAGLWFAARAGFLGAGAKAFTGDLLVSLSPIFAGLNLPIVPCPTAEELAPLLGVSVWKVREGMKRSGKDGCKLTAADLSGIPEVPDTVMVNGVPSHPNPTGAPATFKNPTGGSSTWGNLTDSQIQQAFLNSNGGDAGKAAAAWQAQHDKEVRERGF